MGQYSIKELEKLSGIKAHTIRIWEKRHHIVEPQRTGTNIRLYSDDDLKRIINVALLNNHGIRISQIARMTREQISNKIKELSDQKSANEIFIDQLVVAMVDMDEEKFNEIATALVKRYGFERTIIETIYPFLEKIGVLWQAGTVNPAQEHFISNLIRQQLITAGASLPVPPKSARKAILFLPEGEFHEFGLLFFNYIARSKGIYTYYLGQSVPFADLKAVYEIHKPQFIITSFVSTPSATEVKSYVEKMSREFADATIIASGNNLRNTAFIVPRNFKVIYKSTELAGVLESA
ncbi:MAG: MerR family transcriptional regulator [Flammeovirgaceae bacterium]|nr:MAG: MerR family transcriptional regulator [Flammeovirgaceae bacterium]